MNFCPLCANALIIQNVGGNNRFSCRTCTYFYPLLKKIETVTYSRMLKDDTIHDISLQKESRQTDKDMICPACEKRGAYIRLEQDRSLDEGQTQHYICKNCSHAWKDMG
ncbi:hypothetical protein ABPG72_007538 [Tetrahymena utriculariae]